MRIVFFAGLGLIQIGLLCCTAAFGQSARRPEFEVASVRPTSLDIAEAAQALRAGVSVRAGKQIRGDRIEYIGMTLGQLICDAYEIRSVQLDGPGWLSGPRFDITARLPAGATTEDVSAMLQTLLAERFKLVAHRDVRNQQVTALIISKDGLKLKETPPEELLKHPDSINEAGGFEHSTRNDASTVTMRRGQAVIRYTIKNLSVANPPVHLEAIGVTMRDLAELITQIGSGGLVLDATGLKGHYDISFDMSLSEMQGNTATAFTSDNRAFNPAGTASEPSGTSTLLKSLHDLGLELTDRKMPVAKLVIDHVERTATEN